MKFGINQNGINYFIVKRNEFFCTYYSGGMNIEVTVKNVFLSYIQRMTITELLKYSNKEVIKK